MMEELIGSLEKEKPKSDEVVFLNFEFNEQQGYIPTFQLGKSVMTYMRYIGALYHKRNDVFYKRFDKKIFDSKEVCIDCYVFYDYRLPEISGWLLKKGMSEHGFYNISNVILSSDKEHCVKLLKEVNSPTIKQLQPASQILPNFMYSVEYKIRKRNMFRPRFRPGYQVIQHFAQFDPELVFVNKMNEQDSR